MKEDIANKGIPISPMLNSMTGESPDKKLLIQKSRLIRILFCSVIVAVFVSIIARLLVWLINLFTNICFYGSVNINYHSPAGNHLGWWVILVPAAGGIVVGFMALYGSKAIRGHGIPEAMEQILVNQSRIKPSITLLKPLSSAIAIGSGGPFGAEGPIIATGGALGSTVGQLFKITSNERKVILAAGATAGMSAIFGTPIAAIFLAIELLLFEFSPKAILPVALACITGAAGHHLLFEAGPVFPMPDITIPSNLALGIYSLIGIVIGLTSLLLTKAVYVMEDLFEKLPVHWMWWPALGGLGVGVIGHFFPYTLGVGYENITSVLSGNVSLTLLISLCLFKFLSWAIALGSGTSGGTLAPLLTIGGAIGAIVSSIILAFFPQSGIYIPLGALIGMSAMFAGASRAYLTSITFALEATMQSHALLPLLGACSASYLVSFFLMENTIMTEKIARRGVVTPNSYEPDILQKFNVAQLLNPHPYFPSAGMMIKDLKSILSAGTIKDSVFFVLDDHKKYIGSFSVTDLYNHQHPDDAKLSTLVSPPSRTIKPTESLRTVVEIMSVLGVEALPVIKDDKLIGVIAYRDIISCYKNYLEESEGAVKHISLKRQRIKMLLRGKKMMNKND